jgi:hypothetical protein
VNDLVFAGINVGIVGFVIGLLAEATWLKQVSTPVLGAAILVGLVELTMRLQAGSTIEPATATAVPAATTT